jgi:hypothetical protein
MMIISQQSAVKPIWCGKDRTTQKNIKLKHGGIQQQNTT